MAKGVQGKRAREQHSLINLSMETATNAELIGIVQAWGAWKN